MNISKKLLSGTCFLAIIFLMNTAKAQWQELDSQTLKSVLNPVSATVESMTADETTIEFQLSGFDSQEIQLEDQDFTVIQVPGLTQTEKRGLPALPKWNRNILIPFHAQDPNLEIVDLRTEDFQLGVILPSKGTIMRNEDAESIPYSFADFYRGDSFYPEKPALLSTPFQMRDVRGTNLEVHPFQYNPATRTLRVIRSMTLRIHTPVAGFYHTGIFSGESMMDASFWKLYELSFLNFNQVNNSLRELQHLIQDSGKLLIVSHPDFASGLSEFILWKKQKGLQVELVTTTQTGKTAQEIQKFILEKYRASKISYVLLVGDAEFIPPFPGTAGNVKNNEADPLYGVLEGNDNYPELMVSRFSVKNLAGLATITSKVIRYEREPDLNGTWYSRASGVASAESGSSGVTDFARAEMLREMLEKWHFNNTDKIYDPGAKAAQLTQALNEGRGYINYIGHGSKTSWGTTGFSNSSINALANQNRIPFIVSVACVNAQFAGSGESFAERWLLAGTPQEPRGAVAIYASSTNQSWVPPTVGQKKITELLTTEKLDTIGMLFAHGGIAVLEDNSDTAAQTYQSWHIMGDATMQVRTQKPRSISVTIPDQITLTGGNLVINSKEAGLILGITEGDTWIGQARSGTDGKLIVPVKSSGKAPRTLTLTLTGFNRAPLMKKVTLK